MDVSTPTVIRDRKLMQWLELNEEKYDLVKLPGEDMPVCISKRNDHRWMCGKCGVYHDNLKQFRIDYIFNHMQHGITYSTCSSRGMNTDKMICTVCALNKSDELFNFNIDLPKQKAATIIFHCSERCREITNERFKSEPTRYSTCGYCGAKNTSCHRCSACKRVYYCSDN